MHLIEYYNIDSSYGSRLDNESEINFSTKELITSYIVKNIKPNYYLDIKFHIPYSNLAIIESKEIEVEETYKVGKKEKIRKVKKNLTNIVVDYSKYATPYPCWLEEARHPYRNTSFLGYFETKEGPTSIEIKESSVVFSSPLLVRFVAAKVVKTPEIKTPGVPYQAATENIEATPISDWLPLFKEEKYMGNSIYRIENSKGYYKTALATYEVYINRNEIRIVENLEEVGAVNS